MKFNGYEIYVTEQELPHLEATWTNIDTTSSNTYKFKREINKSKVFNISGYISMPTWAETKTEAEGLNNSLNTTPSGIFIDGHGTSYTCLVDNWMIEPVAGANKYLFSMSLRMKST